MKTDRSKIIRAMILGTRLVEAPPVDYKQFIIELRRVGTNLNQLTAKANAIGFIDRAELVSSLHYAADKDKTTIESEQRLLVDGINCDPDIAAQQMIDTKEMYGKTGGIVAYHAYISFKPGEVTPEEAQEVSFIL